jgi:hypothetical protein
MPAGTTIGTIYSAIGAVVTRATGRSWWKKAGMQGQPSGTYATVYVTQGDAIAQQVVEHVKYTSELETGEIFRQIPWGTTSLDVQVEFWRSATSNSAIDAAIRFFRSLYLEARWSDLWIYCSLAGSVKTTDISAMFRADIEPRARVEFRIFANLSGPDPLLDVPLHDIQKQPLLITEQHGSHDLETDIAVDNTGEITQWPTT